MTQLQHLKKYPEAGETKSYKLQFRSSHYTKLFSRSSLPPLLMSHNAFDTLEMVNGCPNFFWSNGYQKPLVKTPIQPTSQLPHLQIYILGRFDRLSLKNIDSLFIH